MIPRERVLTALRRKVPDRVPIFLRMSPPVLKVLKEKTGYDTPEEYFDLDIRQVTFHPTRCINEYRQYFEDFPEANQMEITEWGVGKQKGSLYGFERMIAPMRNFSRLEEFEAYPFPDVTADYRMEGLEEKIRNHKNNGYAVRGRMPEVIGTLWESAWALRGMENFLIDMSSRKDFAHYLLDKLLSLHAYNAERFARTGIDIIHFSEDLGTQQSLIMSLAMFREMLKPRWAEMISRAKSANPKLLVFLHSDGAIEPLIPDLIDIGMDILNPLQPECMDPARIKRMYGDKLAFWGSVGTQTTFPFGTRDEMRRVVKERIETVGRGGGFLIDATHTIEPEVPWENILTFVEAAREFGSYH